MDKMTPQEKLKEIEAYYNLSNVLATRQWTEEEFEGMQKLQHLTGYDKIGWLIARIKELEAQNKKLREALEKIEKHQGHAVGAYTFGWREIARQALTEGEEK